MTEIPDDAMPTGTIEIRTYLTSQQGEGAVDEILIVNVDGEGGEEPSLVKLLGMLRLAEDTLIRESMDETE